MLTLSRGFILAQDLAPLTLELNFLSSDLAPRNLANLLSKLVVMGIKVYKTVSFIRNKGDRHKSENCSLQDGLQLCANK